MKILTRDDTDHNTEYVTRREAEEEMQQLKDALHAAHKDRMADAESRRAGQWRTGDPPKDGTKIVAIGVITEDCGDGRYNIEPFTDSIQWDGEDWLNEFGLALASYAGSEITIRYWLPFPPNAKPTDR